jgi:hypothetical protein
MKTLFAAALTAGILAAATPAIATPVASTPAATVTPMTFTIDMKNTGVSAASNVFGNSYKYQATASNGEKVSVMVTAWTRGYSSKDPSVYNTIKQAKLASFGNDGLGIYQDGEIDNPGFHQIDNTNGWEFLTLQFSRAVNLTGGIFNTFDLAEVDDNGNVVVKDGKTVFTHDNDAFIGWGNNTGAWDSNLKLQNYNWDQVSGGLMGSGNTNSDGTAVQKISLTNAMVNTWMIGASMNGPDSLHDAFKLAQVTVTAVPEPTTWAMMLVGFGMVGAAARYRRRKSTVQFV